MKQIGIWIDKKEAKIISIEQGTESINTVASDVESYNPTGGSGTKLKGGPQDVVQDSKFLERERHQLAEFFKKIVENIDNADSLVIFGPAQAGMKLNEELAKKYSQIHAKVKSVEKADSMTDNQVKAWVRDYYSS
ncbi:MAG: hypothetical protein HKN22_07850 [Bacteroidia bacterium]|nr:hypothetical protein [Bacteroidia bacterium]